jgi:ketosteroid isomerase-like protein
MDPDIEWNEAENFIYADGNPYIGPTEIVDGVFARLAGEWDGWALHTEHFLDAGPSVVVLGRYTATLKKTGARLDAQFAHVWWLRGGKAVRFQQYTDTAQVARIAAGR